VGRRWIAAGALTAIAGAAVFLATRSREPTVVVDPCRESGSRIATVWSPARADAVRTALGDVPWAPAALGALEARSAAWAASERRACEMRHTPDAHRSDAQRSDAHRATTTDAHRATTTDAHRATTTDAHRATTADASTLDLQARCFDHALERFGALIDAIAPIDPPNAIDSLDAPKPVGATSLDAPNNAVGATSLDAPNNAVGATSLDAPNTVGATSLAMSTRVMVASAIVALPDTTACESLGSMTGRGLHAEPALPADPAGKKRALAALREIARVEAALSLGRDGQARMLVDEIERDVAGLDAPPVLAELALQRAAVETRSGTPATAKLAIERALAAARRANTPSIEARVWAIRLRREQAATEEPVDPSIRIEELLSLAKEAARRAGLDGGELENIAGEAALEVGQLDLARKRFERAWASTDGLGADRRAVIAMNLGDVHLLTGDIGKADGAYVRAREIATTAFGPGHPALATYVDRLAAVARTGGRVRDALALDNTSLELRVAAYGNDDRSIATSLVGRARTYLELGDLGSAGVDAFRALEIRRAAFGDSPQLADIEALLGDLALASGDRPAAKIQYERARALDAEIPMALRMWTATMSRPRLRSPRLDLERASVHEFVGACIVIYEFARPGSMAEFMTQALKQRIDQWRRISRPVDPTMTYVLGMTLLRVGDKSTATEVFTAGLAALPDEPTRTRLRFARRVAELEPTNADAQATAKSLRAALPKLGDSTIDAPGPD
jgi:tetratricopeptide (TPR) repeat protein